MTSKLEQKIMRKVMMISLFREFRKRTPIKVFLLAITLSFSTEVISYKLILSYLRDKEFVSQISYLFNSLIHTSPFKLILIAIILYLALSALYGAVKTIRLKNSQLKLK